MTELWINNPKILLNNLNQFFISNELNDNENKNAIARFGLYFGILILIFDEDNKWLLLSILIMIISLFYNKNHEFFTLLSDLSNQTILPNQTISSDLNKLNDIKSSKQPDSCYKPNKNNPFMNYTIGDLIETPLREHACNYSDVKDGVKKEFKKYIFSDSYDIWNKNSSDRNFYTLPNTNIVNDQSGFAKWCFGDSGRCKTVGENCLKYKDPLYHRGRGT